MDIIENVKHGLVFWVFGVIAVWLILAQTGTTGVDALYGLISPQLIEFIVIAFPFFLMGFFDKMLD